MRFALRIGHGVRQDVAFAVRLLRKSPILAAATILTLALGVGVNVAVFSVFNAFLLRPLPVRDAEHVVVLASEDERSRRLGAMSFKDLEDYRSAADVFEDVAGYSVGFLGLTREQAERVLVTWVTGSYFSLLDMQPALGRLIRADEVGPGRAEAVVVLGYGTWQRRFGGDPSVLGTVVDVGGVPSTVIGVAPRGFLGTFAFSETELFLPMSERFGGDFVDREARGVHTLVRLRPGTTIPEAQSAADAVAARLAREHPESNAGSRVRVVPERLARPEEDQARVNASGAALMLAMVALVMAVAAVNVTNLLLARAAARAREIAIRAAVGAGRGRLIRQMLTESLVLAGLGGALGAVGGVWVTRALQSLRPPGDLPVHFDFEFDARVLAYTSAVTLVCGVLIGLPPALRASGTMLHRLTQSRFGPKGARLRGVLIVGQIALTFVLLVAAGLFARSTFEAERADLGFDPDSVLNVHLDVTHAGYTEDRGRLLFEEIARRVGTLPGVETLSYAATIPLGYVRAGVALEAEGRPVGDGERLFAGINRVSPDYFATMDIPLAQGRVFADSDREQSPPVAIVNRSLAERLWPGRNPLGQRFRSAPEAPWTEVVGVVRTGKYEFLFEEPRPYFYLPIAQGYSAGRVLQIRTSLAPEALAPAVESAIRALDANVLLYDVQSMRRALGSGPGYFPLRVSAAAIAVLGALAFALAIVGVYGVVSYLTGQRTQEIAVRVAVGATGRDVARLVLVNGMRFVAVGIAIGLAIGMLASRAFGRFLFGVSAHDPITLGTATLLLAGVALLACALPARRAARVSPTVALRAE